MPKRRPATQKYHDRVAGRYDDIYDDAYWAWHDRITWEHIRGFLPKRVDARVLDLGCGTGKWGLKLLESGYAVTFVDISGQMLDQARGRVAGTSWQRRADFVQADLMDLSTLPDATFELAVAMGEPIGCCDSPPAALSQVRRLLSPDGRLVATFDNRLACIDHYLQAGDAAELEAFLRSGRTQWLTRERAERFTIHTYSPAQLRQLLEKIGFECVDMIGKTVLPMRMHRERLADAREARQWAEIERGLHRVEAALGRCAHLQVAARRA